MNWQLPPIPGGFPFPGNRVPPPKPYPHTFMTDGPHPGQFQISPGDPSLGVPPYADIPSDGLPQPDWRLNGKLPQQQFTPQMPYPPSPKIGPFIPPNPAQLYALKQQRV